MPSKDFSTCFSKFRHPLVHTTLFGLFPTVWEAEPNDRNPWTVNLKRREGSVNLRNEGRNCTEKAGVGQALLHRSNSAEIPSGRYCQLNQWRSSLCRMAAD